MKRIKSDELFGNLSEFLKTKGIELKEGAYTERVRQSCNLLTQAVNGTRKTLETAKHKVDATLDQVRQTIHEKTAPKPPPIVPPRKPSMRRVTPTAGARRRAKK